MNEESDLALRQMEVVANLQLNYQVDNQQILIAGERDRVENNFINAVFTTRRAAEEVSEAITDLSVESSQLRRGEYAKQRILHICRDKVKNIMNLLNVVNFSADTELEPIGYAVENFEECHGVARRIKGAVLELITALNMFQGSLDEDPIHDAPENFQEVLAKSNQLYSLVNSFPPLQKSNYRIQAIQRSVMNVTGRNN